ncbi:MAG: amino acid permease [Candidatus Thermoplasmatota archaeon]|jgi:amino acid transporter|nr:amino acid permease [Candidatus Thermoplasmatota archaeon]
MDSSDLKTEDPGELKRHLSFRDVFFLSFGGMSPLLSLLTYGAVALSYGGLIAPIIIVLGTMLVLVNGLVVMQLSKRFRTSGGYYTYAFQALSDRVGFSTGWVYLFYALLFGMAYVTGAVYVVSIIFGFPIYLTLLGIVLPASVFLILGIKPSATYAIYTGIAEICLILAIVGISFYIGGGSAYLPDPISYHISGSALALGILFAMGIPTGYGAIAPISGEVKNPEKVVGRSAISVILAGGLLASLFIYAISNLLIQTGSSFPSGTSSLPIVSIILGKFSVYSRYLAFGITIAAINDGILAILSFGAAASRTMFRMGYDRAFPTIFAKKLKNQPIVSNVAVSLVITVFPLIMFLYLPISSSFIILGTIASLGGLFIHIMAGTSLLRIGLRRGKRLVIRGTKNFLGILNDYREAFLAGIASLITAIELIYSAYSTKLVYATLFLLWIVAGYVVLDIRDVVMKAPYISRLTKGEISVAEKFKDLTSLKIRSALPDVSVSVDDSLKSAVRKCISLDAQGAVVIDNSSIPVGTLTLRDVFMLSDSELERISVRNWWLDRPVLVRNDTGVLDIIKIFKETGIPILCIVDDDGKFSGTVREREVILALGGLEKKSRAQTES